MELQTDSGSKFLGSVKADHSPTSMPDAILTVIRQTTRCNLITTTRKIMSANQKRPDDVYASYAPYLLQTVFITVLRQNAGVIN